MAQVKFKFADDHEINIPNPYTLEVLPNEEAGFDVVIQGTPCRSFDDEGEADHLEGDLREKIDEAQESEGGTTIVIDIDDF